MSYWARLGMHTNQQSSMLWYQSYNVQTYKLVFTKILELKRYYYNKIWHDQDFDAFIISTVLWGASSTGAN